MTISELDRPKVEAFGGRVAEMLNDAATVMGFSIGHRMGMFDALEGRSPSTSAEIASAATVNERYAREWLNSMVVARVVEYDREGDRYFLPPEHAASLTRAAGTGNLAALGRFVGMMGQVEDELLEPFKNGGGVPYSSYDTFHHLMAELSTRRFDNNLVDVQIPLVPGIEQHLDAGIDVADLGCGSGHAINLMAQAWPNSRFTGIDFSADAIALARVEAATMGLENATFETQDVATLQGAEEYDLITVFDTVHDQADPTAMLENAARLLKRGGAFLCADTASHTNVADNLDDPRAPLGYTVSLFHCMTVSLALGGVGLGSMWGQEKALEMFADAGFRVLDISQVDGDRINNFYVATKD